MALKTLTELWEERMISFDDKEPLRRGEWTEAEEAYVEALVDAFHDGLLDISKGQTLRALLAKCVHCHPKRISKKMEKCDYHGRGTYMKKANLTEQEVNTTENKLRALSMRFEESVQGYRNSARIAARNATTPSTSAYVARAAAASAAPVAYPSAASSLATEGHQDLALSLLLQATNTSTIGNQATGAGHLSSGTSRGVAPAGLSFGDTGMTARTSTAGQAISQGGTVQSQTSNEFLQELLLLSYANQGGQSLTLNNDHRPPDPPVRADETPSDGDLLSLALNTRHREEPPERNLASQANSQQPITQAELLRVLHQTGGVPLTTGTRTELSSTQTAAPSSDAAFLDFLHVHQSGTAPAAQLLPQAGSRAPSLCVEAAIQQLLGNESVARLPPQAEYQSPLLSARPTSSSGNSTSSDIDAAIQQLLGTGSVARLPAQAEHASSHQNTGSALSVSDSTLELLGQALGIPNTAASPTLARPRSASTPAGVEANLMQLLDPTLRMTQPASQNAFIESGVVHSQSAAAAPATAMNQETAASIEATMNILVRQFGSSQTAPQPIGASAASMPADGRALVRAARVARDPPANSTQATEGSTNENTGSRDEEEVKRLLSDLMANATNKRPRYN
ncbi:expressed unknown protein [Seminavis robusta]|uniref:Uncharacterized protein n=1 Tax=Seminavis robusta TaxID=568900 RepID=A0A9N8E4A3_9STRA|nr:expressed unknown protein [Seminavis robusta]|eukprot:Sro633_g178910.1 n/a (625) ;mRNA; r:47237-49111